MTAIILVISYWLFKAFQDGALESGKGFNPKGKYDPDMIQIGELSPKTFIEKAYVWYHIAVGADYLERFPLSASFLVMFTDRWHVFGTMRHLAISIAIWHGTGWPWWSIVVLYASGLVVFNSMKYLYVKYAKS